MAIHSIVFSLVISVIVCYLSLSSKPASIMVSNTNAAFYPNYKTVVNEGAYLKYGIKDPAPLLILILGGGCDGSRFNKAIPSLSEHYTSMAYDHRGNVSSRVVYPGPLNPIQSACDVVAIIKALGFSKTSI